MLRKTLLQIPPDEKNTFLESSELCWLVIKISQWELMGYVVQEPKRDEKFQKNLEIGGFLS